MRYSVAVFGFRFFGGFRSGAFERGKNQAGSLLDDLQALGEQGCVAVVQVDVIRRCPACVEADGLADYKGDCLGFGFAYCLGGCGAPLCLVQHLVRQFMHKG